MVKTLVVMRHGKALPPQPDQPDSDRRLTKPGRQALSSHLPSMLGPLQASREAAQIWSSPAKRALQTAMLLTDALEERGDATDGVIRKHDSLWEQDVDAFMAELDSCTASTVFVVGHAPFVEDLVKKLAGSTPPFSPGALACLQLASSASDARLLWFMQGPKPQTIETTALLQTAISRAADRMEARRAAFFNDPEDIETMHKFRVSIRTLRSLVAFVKPWQNASQNAKTQALLKSVVAYTSRQRELDVFEKQARANEAASPEMIAFCKQEADTEREHVIKALSSKRTTKSFEGALELARDIQWKRGTAAMGLTEADVRAHFDAMVDKIEADLASLSLVEVERTHDVRKRAKRVRYAAENFDEVLGDDAVSIAKGMTAHQDNLGDVCDARVNIGLINEFLQRDLPNPVAWDLILLRAANETFLYNALKASQR